MWWQGQGGVGHGDLTAQANAVSAAGDPWPYYDPVRKTNIVAFRGTDQHIRSLYWGGGAVGQDDLSGVAGTPAAAGDPFAWFTPADDTHRIVYRAANGHIHELSWPNVAPVRGRDLTALSGAPPAAGNVSGGYNPADNTQHVIFRSGDGRLHELWHFLGEAAVHHQDLTAAYCRAARRRPACLLLQPSRSQPARRLSRDQRAHLRTALVKDSDARLPSGFNVGAAGGSEGSEFLRCQGISPRSAKSKAIVLHSVGAPTRIDLSG